MAEQQQNAQPTVDDIPAEMLNLEAEDWETAGLTRAGKVGFKVEKATLGAGRTRDGVVFPRAELELVINARPDREVTGKGERHWENIRLDGNFLRKFKGLTTAAGIKIPAGSKLSLQEVIKALNGRPAFGTIQHRKWTGRDGTENTSAELGNRFGKSFSDLG
jgi:hypothetical protein